MRLELGTLWCYAECHFFNDMLSAVVLIITMPNVTMPNVVVVSAIVVTVIKLSVVLLNVLAPSKCTLSVPNLTVLG